MAIKNKSIKGDVHFWKTSFFSDFKFLGTHKGYLPGSLNVQGKWGMAKSLLWLSKRWDLIYYTLLLSKRRYKEGGEGKDKY